MVFMNQCKDALSEYAYLEYVNVQVVIMLPVVPTRTPPLV